MSGKANANKSSLRYASSVVEPFFLACTEIFCVRRRSLCYRSYNVILIKQMPIYREVPRNSVYEYPVVRIIFHNEQIFLHMKKNGSITKDAQ